MFAEFHLTFVTFQLSLLHSSKLEASGRAPTDAFLHQLCTGTRVPDGSEHHILVLWSKFISLWVEGDDTVDPLMRKDKWARMRSFVDHLLRVCGERSSVVSRLSSFIGLGGNVVAKQQSTSAFRLLTHCIAAFIDSQIVDIVPQYRLSNSRNAAASMPPVKQTPELPKLFSLLQKLRKGIETQQSKEAQMVEATLEAIRNPECSLSGLSQLLMFLTNTAFASFSPLI